MVFIKTYLGILCQVLIYCIVAWSLLSWFPLRPNNPVLVILRNITEPLVRPLRRIVPRVGMFDLTPLAAIVILAVIQYVVRVVL